MRKPLMQMAMSGIGVSLVAVSTSCAQTVSSANMPLLVQTEAEWAKDVTVLVIAPDGTWGTATAPFIAEALGKAIASCKSKYRREIGCGYRSTAVRAGWSLASRCGRENIIVAARTLGSAEQASLNSEARLRREYHPDMPPCARVVSVDPDGRTRVPNVVLPLQSAMDPTR